MALDLTLKDFSFHRLKMRETKVAELKKIIQEEEIRTVFQPVINLRTHQIVAYEAFSRGPAGSGFENPKKMFDVARKNHLTLELDRLCLKKTLERAKEIDSASLLFINVEPESAFDPMFWGTVQVKPGGADLLLKKIVFEISRNSAALSHLFFLRAVEIWRARGFKVSIDGIGTGYDTLQLIAEAVPDFIKIDPSLIREIDEKEIKKELLKMFAIFAETIGAKLVAEGIETIAELKALKDVGVNFGQGFLIKPPHHKPSRIIHLVDFI